MRTHVVLFVSLLLVFAGESRAAGMAEAQGTTAVQTRAKAASTPNDASIESRLDVIRLLRAREFARLTRIIEAKQKAVEQNIRNEMALVRVLSAFQTSDPAVTPLLNAWVDADRSSYAPRLARAHHLYDLAWTARGTDWGSNTSAEQKRGMQAHLANLVIDADAALALNPRLTTAYARLIDARRGLGDVEGCYEIGTLALEQMPASATVRLALANCFRPRWGGSYELLEALAQDSNEHLSENPDLAFFQGFVDWDRGTLVDKDPGEAIRLYTRALDHGPHWYFYTSRARAYFDQQRYTENLEDLARALFLFPENDEALMLRAWTQAAIGRLGDAAADMKLVAELDPPNEMLAGFRKREIDRGVYEGYQEYTKGNVTGAIARYTSTIELIGDDAKLHYWRGWASIKMNDDDLALVDFLDAIRLDPRYFEAYQSADRVLSKRKQFDKVIDLWAKYLSLEPTNGRAFAARAAAHFSNGDEPAGLSDAEKACHLNIQEACKTQR